MTFTQFLANIAGPRRLTRCIQESGIRLSDWQWDRHIVRSRLAVEIKMRRSLLFNTHVQDRLAVITAGGEQISGNYITDLSKTILDLPLRPGQGSAFTNSKDAANLCFG